MLESFNPAQKATGTNAVNIYVARAYVSQALLDAPLNILPARQISEMVEHSIILIVRADTHQAHLSNSLRNLVLSGEPRTRVCVSMHEDRAWRPVHSLRWVNVIIREQHLAALPGLAQAVPTEKPGVLV